MCQNDGIILRGNIERVEIILKDLIVKILALRGDTIDYDYSILTPFTVCSYWPYIIHYIIL